MSVSLFIFVLSREGVYGYTGSVIYLFPFILTFPKALGVFVISDLKSGKVGDDDGTRWYVGQQGDLLFVCVCV